MSKRKKYEIVTDCRQRPLFDVRSFRSQPYEDFSFHWILERYAMLLIRRSDFPASNELLGGAPSWCPVLLSKLVIIQAKEGWSDDETVRRATVDLQVKACLGLGVDQRGPSQPTLSRHRQLMESLELTAKYMQRFLSLLKTLELVHDDEAVAVDSVPLHGAGQVLDTFNLLGAWIHKALCTVARRRGESTQSCAERLEA